MRKLLPLQWRYFSAVSTRDKSEKKKGVLKIMKFLKSTSGGILPLSFILALGCMYLSGCGDKFYDPTQIGRFRPVPTTNVILDTLGVAEESPSRWEGAEEPRPIDVIAYERDYVFAPGDIVKISIFELLRQHAPFENDFVVTETGKISIPEVGVVQAKGLTEEELEEEIKGVVSPHILKDPRVTATLLRSEKRTFSILGQAVPGPGRYHIPRYDYRLTDALAEARVQAQFNVSYIYVSRPIRPEESLQESPVIPKVHEEIDTQDEMMKLLSPRAQKHPEAGFTITATEFGTDEMLDEAALPDEFRNSPEVTAKIKKQYDSPVSKQKEADTLIVKPVGRSEGRIEWVFENGKWVPVRVGGHEKAIEEEKQGFKETGALKKRLPADFEWDELMAAKRQRRVIKIPTDKLMGGDPRYNIIVRPGDSIHVPVDVIGEFAIMGNTNFQGFVSLTGRPMTLKMAIASAGGLGPLAWPKRCEVIRRIGKNEEEIVMVDLEKIAAGEQPDFYIKPNDLINVGTHSTSRWRAVLRNSFRATYGFGFIYDRNFATLDYGKPRTLEKLFDWF